MCETLPTLDVIALDIEPLPHVVDLEAAAQAGAVLVHPDWQDYEQVMAARRDGSLARYSASISRP